MEGQSAKFLRKQCLLHIWGPPQQSKGNNLKNTRIDFQMDSCLFLFCPGDDQDAYREGLDAAAAEPLEDIAEQRYSA